MNDIHCPACGKFAAARSRKSERRGDLLAMMQGERRPSEPHVRAERTKAQKRRAQRLAHLQGWLAAGVCSPKATRLIEGVVA